MYGPTLSRRIADNTAASQGFRRIGDTHVGIVCPLCRATVIDYAPTSLKDRQRLGIARDRLADHINAECNGEAA